MSSSNVSDYMSWIVDPVCDAFNDNGTNGTSPEPPELYPDQKAVEKAWYILVGIIGGPVGVLGILFNFMSLGVLVGSDMRSSNSTLYLIALALYDLLFLIANCLVGSLEYFHYGLTDKEDWYKNLSLPSIPVAIPLTGIAISGSVWTTIALSLDRSVGVTQPFKWPRICTSVTVKGVLLLVFLWSVLINVPFMMEFYIGPETDPATNETFLSSLPRAYQDSHFHQDVYLVILHPLADAFLPVVILCVTNIIIIVTLRRQQRAREAMNIPVSSPSGSSTRTLAERRSRDTTRITGQVIFISVFCFISRALRTTTFVVMRHHDTTFVNHCPFYCGFIAALSHFFNIVNASINFFCYCYFGQKFRKNFIQKYGFAYLYRKLKGLAPEPTTQATTRTSAVLSTASGIMNPAFQPASPDRGQQAHDDSHLERDSADTHRDVDETNGIHDDATEATLAAIRITTFSAVLEDGSRLCIERIREVVGTSHDANDTEKENSH